MFLLIPDKHQDIYSSVQHWVNSLPFKQHPWDTSFIDKLISAEISFSTYIVF